MTKWYREDLAYIHEVGHAEFALGSAPGIRKGLVVDLGSGLWARELVNAGYGVVGIDISEAMVEISRRRAPEAEFRVASLFEAEIPPCVAVTAVGEILNYLFDEEVEIRGLGRLFRRVYGALEPGGVFDLVGPGQVCARGGNARNFSEGEDRDSRIYTRRIISFRKLGELYRRDDETHRQRLYEPARVAKSYGRYRLSKAHRAFVARKPG